MPVVFCRIRRILQKTTTGSRYSVNITGTKLILFFLAALGLAAGGWWIWHICFGPSDEDQIRQTLENIRLCLEKKDFGEPILESAGKLGDLKKYLADEMEYYVPDRRMTGKVSPDYVTQKLFLARKWVTQLKVTFGKIDIHISNDPDTGASAVFQARADYSMHGGQFREIFPLQVTFRKQGGKWLVRKVEMKR